MTESRRYRRVGVGERAARSRANSMSNCFLPRDCVAASRSHATGRRAAGKRRDRTRGQADNYDISEELSPVIKMWRAEIESEIFVYVGSMAGAVNRLRCYPRNRLPRIPGVFFRPRSLRAATSARRSLDGRSGFFISLYARVLGAVFSRGRIARSFLRNDLIGTCARRIVFV